MNITQQPVDPKQRPLTNMLHRSRGAIKCFQLTVIFIVAFHNMKAMRNEVGVNITMETVSRRHASCRWSLRERNRRRPRSLACGAEVVTQTEAMTLPWKTKGSGHKGHPGFP
ncbi:hypothetical protein QQF64_016418 [Cirrhinus molitorella]|uniref:Uncharacterized protein n=1 Tax=Cirrhinus molitorella TaxID=172907 RepID=A0ABR3LR63_9TELE